jgi:hypothetical protein
MDTTILIATLSILAALVLFPHVVWRVRFARLVNKVLGPASYPLVGSVLPLLLAPRNSKYNGHLKIFPLGLPFAMDPFGNSKFNRHSDIFWIRNASGTSNQLQ